MRRISAILVTCLLGLLGLLGMPGAAMAAELPVVQVWKTPTCGCCRVWVQHLEAAGLRVQVTDLADLTAVKQRFAVPPQLASCHTARVAGYVVEGHVPAGDLLRLLREKPAIRGIYVPGMPIGSPGMEGAHAQPYDVLAVDAEGAVGVFATHAP
ncbi:MAG: DUF411 domain-containing protein [Gammaproteobacteria bacterium]|nr:DUF411 domain-containing protein [Gammaproteobacteria bacterium]